MPTPPTPESLLLQPGARPLPDYELVRKLGEGGFGEVWHAHGPGGLDAALKFIRLDGRGSALEVRSLELMKSIRHPNLVSLFGAWHKDNLLILAMELCDRSLQDRLREALQQKLPGIPMKELLNYMRDAAHGLDALNEQNVQHRDVKPANLLLLYKGVKVGDFGLAKMLEQSVASNTGAMTPAYTTPECFKGEITKHSDQYSLAVTFYHLRTGRLLFEGTYHQVAFAHMSATPDLSALPAAEQTVLARALSKEPDKRWRNCKAFVNELIKAYTTATPSKPSLPTPVPVGKPSAKEREIFAQSTVLTPDSKTERDSAPTARRRPAPAKKRRRGPLLAILLLGMLLFVGGIGLVGLAAVFLPSIWRQGNKSETRGPQAPVDNARSMKPSLPETLVIQLGDGKEMELVLLNAKGNDEFLMGVPEGQDAAVGEKPQHKVTLTKPFYLAKFLTTQEQYQQVLGETPSYYRKGGGREAALTDVPDQDTRLFPVDGVSWIDANSFCQELQNKQGMQLPALLRNGRFGLPTEAQWEYACRAGATTLYSFGEDPKDLDNFGWYVNNSNSRTHRVGEKNRPNVWGLHDMHGNIWQWCEDYHDTTFYQKGDVKDPLNLTKPDPEYRVAHGGSCLSNAWQCRAACRLAIAPTDRYVNVGFRVAFLLE